MWSGDDETGGACGEFVASVTGVVWGEFGLINVFVILLVAVFLDAFPSTDDGFAGTTFDDGTTWICIG